jgi:hypothetical protein
VKIATLSAPSSAAATGSLLQFARASPGVPVSARRENGGGRVNGWFPNGSLEDRRIVGVFEGMLAGGFDSAHSDGAESRPD